MLLELQSVLSAGFNCVLQYVLRRTFCKKQLTSFECAFRDRRSDIWIFTTLSGERNWKVYNYRGKAMADKRHQKADALQKI